MEKGEEALRSGQWLRPTNDFQHINLAEVDAAIEALSLLFKWQAKNLHIKTDSLSDTLSDNARVRTIVAGTMLMGRLSIVTELIQEYNLSVDVMLVALNQNLADRITRVLQMWLDMNKKRAEHVQEMYATSLDTMSPSQVMEVYQRVGHPGVRCTT